ncbi:MAG TPA: ester cyclase [Pirellulales bacterium]|nr:ester cyclase [Pirellulales bacterium]
MALLLTAAASPSPGQAIDRAQAVELARDYLSTDDDTKRTPLAVKLATYGGDIPSVLRALSARSFKPVKSGYHPQEHFTVPELLAKHPKDLLYFNVPDSYRPDRPTGLIVFLHGGGKTTSRRAPRVFLNFPDEDDEESNQLGDVFSATGMIAVGPSAPWDDESWYRWCLRESEPYLADVIVECKSRFNIDPDRVFLLGHSMGGFGAYHHVQRQPDRFAAVIVSAGSWRQAYWPVIRGTPLCIVQGVHTPDCVLHHEGLESHGPGGLRQRTEAIRAAFSNIQIDVEQVTVQGDWVVSRWHGSMTHPGPWMGTPPTGKRIRTPSADGGVFGDFFLDPLVPAPAPTSRPTIVKCSCCGTSKNFRWPRPPPRWVSSPAR